MAAAVLAAMVLVSAVHSRLDNPDPDTMPAPAPAPGPTGSGSPPATGYGKPPPAGEIRLSGGDVAWTRVCGVDLPVSDRYGPRQHDGDRVSGFGPGPAGAVLAALHLTVRVSPQLGPDVFLPTLAEQVTGPDANVLAHEVHTQYEQLQERAGAPYGQPLCPIYGRFTGFLLDSHTQAASSLRLLIEAPGADGGPQLASVLVQLSWVDGDWRLVAPPRGDWSRVRTLLPASATVQYHRLAPGR